MCAVANNNYKYNMIQKTCPCQKIKSLYISSVSFAPSADKNWRLKLPFMNELREKLEIIIK